MYLISVEINSDVSKMIQANSLLFNFQMKSPCYLVTLSLESSDFQTFLKQYHICHFSAFGALIFHWAFLCIYSSSKHMTIYLETIYWS